MILKIGDTIEFRGCFFDDGWEFDGPCVLYMGTKSYGEGNNSGKLDYMIEDALIDALEYNKPLKQEFDESDLKEFKWRGWNPDGFARRKKAWHKRVIVKIRSGSSSGELEWDEILREEQGGPFDD